MVVLAFVAAVGALTYLAVTRAQSVNTARDRVATLEAAAARADLALVDIAASQRGYVAPGQGVDFWSTRVDAALADARGALAALDTAARDPEAGARIDSALSRLDDLTAMDARARAFALDGQRQMASDLVFADGYEIIAAARTDAAEAASVERAAAAAPLTLDSQVHLAAIGGLALIAAVAVLLSLRRPKDPEPLVTTLDVAPAGDMTPASRSAAPATTDDSIGAALDASLASLDQYEPTEPVEPVEPIEPVEPAAVNLSAAADVCVDLARLLDMRDLQAVLARAATVLQADGLIVWVMDPAGKMLAPALMHGYAPDLVARLGTLPMDADNATAAAWREKRAQTVEGSGDRSGAVAVPMLTGDGCMGVLSVEVRNGRERASDVQALARIVAAQLAAVVAPPAAEARRAAEA